MSRDFTPFYEFRDWIKTVKKQHGFINLTTIIRINADDKKVDWDESCVSVLTDVFSCPMYFKAHDTHKTPDSKSPFERMVLEIFDNVKRISKKIVVFYEPKKHYRLNEHPDFKFIEDMKSFSHTFYWTGKKLGVIVECTVYGFKKRLLELQDTKYFGPDNKTNRSVKLFVECNNDGLYYGTHAVERAKYYQMKYNLLFWMNFMPIEIIWTNSQERALVEVLRTNRPKPALVEVPHYAKPVLNLINIIFAGLSKENAGHFRDFLIRGLYDPRLLFLIELFLVPFEGKYAFYYSIIPTDLY